METAGIKGAGSAAAAHDRTPKELIISARTDVFRQVASGTIPNGPFFLEEIIP